MPGLHRLSTSRAGDERWIEGDRETKKIAASPPQAKGRVERHHGTHQDRLVKKMRLAGIADYETANRYLGERYLREHNAKFACEPAAEAVAQGCLSHVPGESAIGHLGRPAGQVGSLPACPPAASLFQSCCCRCGQARRAIPFYPAAREELRYTGRIRAYQRVARRDGPRRAPPPGAQPYQMNAWKYPQGEGRSPSVSAGSWAGECTEFNISRPANAVT